MAKMIDQRPSFEGEGIVWDALKQRLPDQIIVYNHHELKKGGQEFDFCLLIENKCVLFIEVKGWLADKIDVRGVDEIIVEGYPNPQKSPEKQSRKYRFLFRDEVEEQLNANPLVLNMVCYPFITKTEYYSKRLDIISNENETIFKEELQDSETLIQKIQTKYEESANCIVHDELGPELLWKLRNRWEPHLEKPEVSGESFDPDGKPYSILSVYPNDLSPEQIKENIDDYFNGVKKIMFVGSQSLYLAVTKAFDEKFKEKNIQPDEYSLNLGYKSGLKVGRVSAITFNLEVYLVERLIDITASEIFVEEGNFTEDSEEIIQQFSEVTTFNFQQYKVEHGNTEHNHLVKAGAGTGKTTSMVSRIAFLCNKKEDPVSNFAQDIAMVTFTNEAAGNMKNRLKQLFINYFVLTKNPKYLKYIIDMIQAHISTIHRFSMDLLQEETIYTGVGTNFSISSNEYLRRKLYDKYFSQFLDMKEIEEPNFPGSIPVAVYQLRNSLMEIADKLLDRSVDIAQIKPSEMGTSEYSDLPYYNELIEKIMIPAEMEYAEQLRLSNTLQINECPMILNIVLDQFVEKREKVKTLQLKYIFIDEFQDTDDIQIQVFAKLQEVINSKCRMFIVGDLKQSIYRFRGAEMSAFNKIEEMTESLFPWDHHFLTVNYRTDARLLDELDAIFSRMKAQGRLPSAEGEDDRLTGTVVTDVPDSELLVEYRSHGNDEEQFADDFCGILKKEKERVQTLIDERAESGANNLSKNERTIAILVRKNWQAQKIVSYAKKIGENVEYKKGGDLFQLESTHDLYKLVLALLNHDNPVFLVNFIESNYTGLNLDYREISNLNEKERTEKLISILDEFFGLHMNKQWQQIVNEAYTDPVLHVLREIYEALQPWKQYNDNWELQEHYMGNYECLLEDLIGHSRVDTLTLNQISEYLRVQIVTGQEKSSRETEDNDQEIPLICTTVHGAKGLEYGTVILPYTYEDISDIKKVKVAADYSDSKLVYTVSFDRNGIRAQNSLYNDELEEQENINEEARVLYVALTRTIRNCAWIRNVDSHSKISWATLMED